MISAITFFIKGGCQDINLENRNHRRNVWEVKKYNVYNDISKYFTQILNTVNNITIDITFGAFIPKTGVLLQ
jgi:hypothetical protein